MDFPTKRLEKAVLDVKEFFSERFGTDISIELLEEEGYLVLVKTSFGTGIFSDYNNNKITYYCYNAGLINCLKKEGFHEVDIYSKYPILIELNQKNFCKFLAGEQFSCCFV